MSILSRLFGGKPKTPRSRHAAPGMLSLVALCPTWSRLEVGEVRDALDSLFPGSFLPPREEGNFVVEGPAPGSSVLVQCSAPGHSGTFHVYHVAGPYGDFSEFLLHIEDPNVRKLAEAQPCWFSVDVLHRHASDDEALRFICVALAKLAPSDATFVVHPTLYLVNALSPESRQVLASGKSPFVAAGALHDA